MLGFNNSNPTILKVCNIKEVSLLLEEVVDLEKKMIT